LKQLENYDCVIPTSNIVNLDQMESASDINRILTIKRDESKSFMTNGCALFKRDAIMKIGGWNEDILGVGQENQFQDLKIKSLLNYKEMSFTGYHLFHRQDPPDVGLIQRNTQILNFYNDGNLEKLKTHVNQTVYKFGQVNKYSSI
jgi:hypothetical protein